MRKMHQGTLQRDKAMDISFPSDDATALTPPKSLREYSCFFHPSSLFSSRLLSLLLQFNSETCFPTYVLFILSASVQILNFLLKSLA